MTTPVEWIFYVTPIFHFTFRPINLPQTILRLANHTLCCSALGVLGPPTLSLPVM